MFPKEVISIHLPAKVEGPKRFMVTKTSNLNTAIHSILGKLEVEVNKRLPYFMYDIQDEMDYLIEVEKESEFYFYSVSKQLGGETLAREIKQAFRVIPNYKLGEDLVDDFAKFMFCWIRERSSIKVLEGLNSMNTKINQLELTNEIKGFNFQEDILFLARYNQVEVYNFFEEIIAELKELAPETASYLDNHGYFTKVRDKLKLYINETSTEEIYLTNTRDILFFD